MRDNPGVFFHESFEDDSYTTHFTDVGHAENQALVGDAFDGDKCLRIRINEDDHNGASIQYRFAKADIPEPEALYARYYLRFGDSWDPGRGGKLPGPAGTYGRAGWGGRKVDGTDGWSARMGFHRSKVREGETQLHFYTYHVDMKGIYGENLAWSIDDLGSLKNGQWYCIETYVAMNTPDKSDGVLRGWVDGKLAMERTDLRFRTVPDLKIEGFWLNLYYGGKWTAPQDMDVYFDNVALSSEPIGPAK
ncbi:hypothetical protein BH23VER1_BH23VER1_24370 [soil metagenome]